MVLRVLKRGPDAKPQVVGEFVWQNGRILAKRRLIAGARALMNRIRLELDPSSEAAARASMESLARRYSGDYLWVHYEP